MIGVVILPLYLQYLGEEAFGLVGFFYSLAGMDAIIGYGNVANVVTTGSTRTRT
ncbi:MAG: hypothetical protein ABFS56_25830 [Pseudomonadota bacterium]